jgi:hypothetical protein
VDLGLVVYIFSLLLLWIVKDGVVVAACWTACYLFNHVCPHWYLHLSVLSSSCCLFYFWDNLIWLIAKTLLLLSSLSTFSSLTSTSGHVYFQMTYYNYNMSNQTNYSNMSINYLPCYIESMYVFATECTRCCGSTISKGKTVQTLHKIKKLPPWTALKLKSNPAPHKSQQFWSILH